MTVTSRVLNRLMRQLSKPTGNVGCLLARCMNAGHASLTNWGLGNVGIDVAHTVLDIGCGGGATIRRLAEIATNGMVYGIDYSRESVEVSRNVNRELIRRGRVKIVQAPVSQLPFPESMFDLATAIETHYFWPDLEADFQEVKRVLKPGGKLLLLAEFFKDEKYDKRNAKWVRALDMAYLSREELDALYSTSGYADVRITVNEDKGWLCGVGVKSPHLSA